MWPTHARVCWVFFLVVFASASLSFALVPMEGADILAASPTAAESAAEVPGDTSAGARREGSSSQPPATKQEAADSKGLSGLEPGSGDSMLANEANGVLLVRALGGLGLVVGLILAGFLAVRRFGPKHLRRPAQQRSLSIVETLPLGEKRSIALIQAGDQRLLIGNTASQITLLLQLPVVPDFAHPAEQKIEARPAAGAVASFRRLYEVEKNTTARPPARQIPPDLREKMRQLREALEK